MTTRIESLQQARRTLLVEIDSYRKLIEMGCPSTELLRLRIRQLEAAAALLETTIYAEGSPV